jgi:hypothetical protein
VLFLLAASGCNGENLDVGTNGDGGVDNPLPMSSDGSVSTDGPIRGGPLPADPNLPPTIAITTCGGAADGAATFGTGLTAFAPTQCDAPIAPAVAGLSVADTAARLVGSWRTCGAPGEVLGMAVPGAVAIQFASDASFVVLGAASDESLVSVDSMGAPETSTSDGASASGSGTYAVVDGSMTYGAGAVELQLHPASGGIFQGQIILSESQQLQFFEPNQSALLFAQVPTIDARAGVCSCVDTTATKVGEYDPSALLGAMVGRWVWCGEQPREFELVPTPAPPVNGLYEGPSAPGIEFTADGALYNLTEDENGVLARGIGPEDQGFFRITSSAVAAYLPWLGPEPLTEVLQTGQTAVFTNIIVTENPRMLLVATTGPDGSGTYSQFSPLP